jgi:hypothetical protein
MSGKQSLLSVWSKYKEYFIKIKTPLPGDFYYFLPKVLKRNIIKRKKY